ncbi:MAG TPA: hypothetical protein VMU85_17985 [Stellaceae bacterium]|nr:hypothetical protein [Stellaceae bacterium]
MSGKRIVIHSLADALAALAAAGQLRTPVILESAAGAGGFAGPAWFKAVVDQARAAFPGVEASAMLDCADEAGTVLAALQQGLTTLRFTGKPTTLRRLKDIARQAGATIETGRRKPALDLLDNGDPAAALRAYLGATGPKNVGSTARRRSLN